MSAKAKDPNVSVIQLIFNRDTKEIAVNVWNTTPQEAIKIVQAFVMNATDKLLQEKSAPEDK